MRKRRVTDTYAVVGAGPLGSCTARTLAEALDAAGTGAAIHLIDANNPIRGDFSGLRAAGPHAAGQLMLHVFEEGSAAKALTRRSHDRMRSLAASGIISLHERPWICCAGNEPTTLDETTREVLSRAYEEGRFAGCELMRGSELPEVAGLRRGAISWALVDASTLAVNPPKFTAQLAAHAVAHPLVSAHFNTQVLSVNGQTLQLKCREQSREITFDGIVVCTGIHRGLFGELLPDSRPEYLHVVDHASAEHIPEIKHLITGETTIARYAGFGSERTAITPHLPEAVQAHGVHGLFTDVPGLRRMLDSHFSDDEEAQRETDVVHASLRATIGRYIDDRYLLGAPSSNRKTTARYVAAYQKLLGTDGPLVLPLAGACRAVYVQPSNGLGLNQCAALGEDAAALLLQL